MNVPRVGIGQGLPNAISPSSALRATGDLRPKGVQSPSGPQPWRTSASPCPSSAVSESQTALTGGVPPSAVSQTVCVPVPKATPRKERRALGQDNQRACVQVSMATVGRGYGWGSGFVVTSLLSCRVNCHHAGHALRPVARASRAGFPQPRAQRHLHVKLLPFSFF